MVLTLHVSAELPHFFQSDDTMVRVTRFIGWCSRGETNLTDLKEIMTSINNVDKMDSIDLLVSI